MESNEALVNYLKNKGYIRSELVEKAFRDVDRSRFVPEIYRENSYEDRALPINQDATISAPHIVALNTELLQLQSQNKVLEIGSGSGYQAAIIAKVSEKVVGVEINRKLVEKSRENLKEIDNVEIIRGSGLEPINSLFDRIIYSAAVNGFEGAKKYLNDNGIIVAPVKQKGIQILKKYRNGEVTSHGKVRFVEMK